MIKLIKDIHDILETHIFIHYSLSLLLAKHMDAEVVATMTSALLISKHDDFLSNFFLNVLFVV